MKRRVSIIVAIVFALITMSFSDSYPRLWKKVDDSMAKNEAKTTLSLLDNIKNKAAKDKSKGFGHYIKAQLISDEIAQNTGFSKAQDDIKEMEVLLTNTSDEAELAVLNFLLVSKYIDFVNYNRYIFSDRTDLADADSVSTDLMLWSMNQFKRKISQHLQDIFINEAALLKAKSKEYQPLIEGSNFGEVFNNDLYHVLFFSVVNRLQSTPYYIDLDNRFNELKTLIDKTKEVYQSNELAIAVIDFYVIDLHPALSNEDRISKLREYIKIYSHLPVVVEAVNSLSNYLIRQVGGKVEAKQICEEYLHKYPKYKRIALLKNTIASIKAPSLELKVEQKAYPDYKFIKSIKYTNTSEFKIALYRVNSNIINLQDSIINEQFILRHTKFTKEKVIKNLPFNNYETEVIDNIDFVAEDLGRFILKTSSSQSDEATYIPIYVSNIKTSFITTAKGIDVFTLDAKTGTPISDVEVVLKSKRPLSKRTDIQGKASFKNLDEIKYLLSAYKGIDVSEYERLIYVNRSNYEVINKQPQGTILSDRGVYRPGQTVFLKGYVFTINDSNESQVLSHYKSEVTITDATGVELTKVPILTNEFGTFNIEYKLPDQILLGTLGVNLPGVAYKRLRVEEYKRPTFQINFDTIKDIFTLGDKVKLSGSIDSFNGSLLKDAKLTIAISSTAGVVPFKILPRGKDKLISQNTLELESDGSFEVEVSLIDTYGYINVEASLTTIGGETQTQNKYVSVQKQGLNIYSSLPSVIDKDILVSLKPKVTNNDGQLIAIKGKYTLSKIEDKVTKKRSKVLEQDIESNTLMNQDWKNLPSGLYELSYEFVDRGNINKNTQQIMLFSFKDNVIPSSEDTWLYVENDTFDESNAAKFAYGVNYEDAVVNIAYYSTEGLIKLNQHVMSKEMKTFEIPYDLKYKDGIYVVIFVVKDMQLNTEGFKLIKKFDDSSLSLSWTAFRDKIKPGSKELWTLKVKYPDGNYDLVELLALMYDASLDQIAPNNYNIYKNRNFRIPYIRIVDYTPINWLRVSFKEVNYYDLPTFDFDHFYSYPGIDFLQEPRGGMGINTRARSLSKVSSMPSPEYLQSESVIADAPDVQETTTLKPVSNVRTNFAETAFFMPNVYPNKEGVARLEFNTPEQLTKWNIRAIAHDKSMRIGLLSDVAYTEKDFSVVVNAPRFLRKSDQTLIKAIVKNALKQDQRVIVKTTWFNPLNNEVISVDKQYMNVLAHSEASVRFTGITPDGVDFIGCRVEATSEKFSDGEQYVLPILSNKEYLTSGLAIYNYGKDKINVNLANLFNKQSGTATDKSVTLEFTNNPIWYAINPLLKIWSEEEENSINLATRLSANLLGYTFKKEYGDFLNQYGKNSTTLLDNEEILKISIRETPWYFNTLKERELLVQFSSLVQENANIIAFRSIVYKLKDLQMPEGGWEWYQGMGVNNNISIQIARVLSRIYKSENALYYKEEIEEMLFKAIPFILNGYKNREGIYTKPTRLNQYDLNVLNIISSNIRFEEAIDKANQNFYNEMLRLVPKVISSDSQYERALATNILLNIGKEKEAKLLAKSLSEHLIHNKSGETHFGGLAFDKLYLNDQLATHIEAASVLYKLNKDQELLNEMKAWLVMKLQHQKSWSPFITADAFTLLALGIDEARNLNTVIEFNGKAYHLNNSKPFMRQKINLEEEKESLSLIISKQVDSPLWGGVIASYYENIENIDNYRSELYVDQKLYKEVIHNNKKELVLVTKEELIPGDIVVSRLEFNLSNTLDYVQLKVNRSSALEPFEQLSGPNYSLKYRLPGNTNYIGNRYKPSYMSIKDTSTNYFYNTLEAGTYVLENRSYVVREGVYQSGIVLLQSVQNAEISAHSQSIIFKVK